MVEEFNTDLILQRINRSQNKFYGFYIEHYSFILQKLDRLKTEKQMNVMIQGLSNKNDQFGYKWFCAFSQKKSNLKLIFELSGKDSNFIILS